MKCLLIEDNIIAQRIPVMIMEAHGWKVDVVATGQDALFAIKNNEYRLIITDIGLPDIDGHELSRVIRTIINNKNLPIIGLSAHDDLAMNSNSKIDIVFCKPFTKEILHQIMDNYFNTGETMNLIRL